MEWLDKALGLSSSTDVHMKWYINLSFDDKHNINIAIKSPGECSITVETKDSATKTISNKDDIFNYLTKYVPSSRSCQFIAKLKIKRNTDIHQFDTITLGMFEFLSTLHTTTFSKKVHEYDTLNIIL